MSLRGTDLLAYLTELRKIKMGGEFIDTTVIERNFMEYSSYNPGGQLTVRFPKMYTISLEEKSRLKRVIEKAKLGNLEVPDKIDISGGFSGLPLDMTLFLSLNQADADHNTHDRSYLNPLIEEIYGKGGRLISDFSLHEPVYAWVNCKRGELSLEELGILPEKFVPGPYEISARLDTPNETIREFSELTDSLQEFRDKPKESLLTTGKISGTTEKALRLRALLGSLSRYENPKKNNFSVSTESCVIRRDELLMFYLYSPEVNKNILVYFGNACPLVNNPQLVVLDGGEHQLTLSKLVENRVYAPSQSVLVNRIKEIESLYENASSKARRRLAEPNSDFRNMLERLKSINSVMDSLGNEDAKRKFVLDQPSELLEFMICPRTGDPILQDLLPHLSWNSRFGDYHDSSEFIKKFRVSSEEDRRIILQELSSTLNFSNQQNNDVNFWLYTNYRDFCLKNDLSFKVLD
jgi:hypothetical protein